MFSIRVHQPNVQGYEMHECRGYKVRPNANGVSIVMQLRDGTTSTVDIQAGGEVYVMSGDGKTVDQIRPSRATTAVLRGGR